MPGPLTERVDNGCIVQLPFADITMPDTLLINQIRSASRLMVRELGFMNSTLAATDYSPSAVHALLEISTHGAMTAAQLVQVLGLDKSSVSRMLSRLQTANEIEENGCGDDGRFKQLSLTTKGQATVARIHEYGAMRVIEALVHLDSAQQQIVAEGLTAYSWALERCRQQPVTSRPNDITIVTGYQPGMIGRIAQMHGEYYARHYGFGHFLKVKSPAVLLNFLAG